LALAREVHFSLFHRAQLSAAQRMFQLCYASSDTFKRHRDAMAAISGVAARFSVT
jgi:hypothetical protein